MQTEVPNTPASKTKKVSMEHMGPGAEVTISYREPNLKDLKVLARAATVTDLIAKHCELLIEVDGDLQPEGWWEELPESVYVEMVSFMEAHRPLKPEGMNGAVGTLPLVWRQ